MIVPDLITTDILICDGKNNRLTIVYIDKYSSNNNTIKYKLNCTLKIRSVFLNKFLLQNFLSN